MSSSALKLYFYPTSGYAHRVLWAAHEKGLVADGTIVPEDLPLPAPEWYTKEVNPRAEVPALRLTDGSALAESLVILSYLDEAFPATRPLQPKDAKDRAVGRLYVADFDAFIADVDALLGEADASKRPQLAKAVEADVTYLERALTAKSDGPFFLGSELSWVDVATVPFVDKYRHLLSVYRGVDLLTNVPRLSAQLAAAEQLPSYRATSRTRDFFAKDYEGVFPL